MHGRNFTQYKPVRKSPHSVLFTLDTVIFLTSNSLSLSSFCFTKISRRNRDAKKMPIKLYFSVASPPARAVLLALKTLNLSFEEQQIDIPAGDNRTKEFLKMNPAHTIPTLVDDDDFVIFDSHAINAYLVNTYAENDELYPSDFKERSIVDRVMYFECGTMFPTVRSTYRQLCVLKTSDSLTSEIVKTFEDIYEILERLLNGQEYIAKNGITIADFSVIATLTSMTLFVPVNADKFPQLAAYLERCQSNIQGYVEINEAGVEVLRSRLTGINLELPSE